MEDARSAITNLVASYAERIDLGDFDGLADLFAHAEITADGNDEVYRGHDQIQAMYTASTRRYPNGTPQTKHVTTNLIIETGDGDDQATCRSYFTVLQAVPGSLALQPVIAGRYHDRFERCEGTWRFARRHMIVDLVGDLSQHLLFAYPGSTGQPAEEAAVNGQGKDTAGASDELEIRNLIGRVALLADTDPDLDVYLALFTDDAVWDFPGDQAQHLPASRTQGHAAILADRRERRATGFQGPGSHTRHLVTVLAVQVDAADNATATADSYWMYLAETDTAPVLRSMGQYHDSFVRTATGWKLAHRQITLG